MATIEEKLKDIEARFGVTLHGHQSQTLKALATGRSVILHVPTGGGKTLNFQAAPSVVPHPGIAVILYPLRALVKDQTRRFKELSIPSVTLYGETKTKGRPEILDQIKNGTATHLLTTPESFDKNRRLQDALRSRGVSLLVVDEPTPTRSGLMGSGPPTDAPATSPRRSALSSSFSVRRR